MFWCFHCYAINDYPSGPCDVCGEPVEAPACLTWAESLIWALRHPDGDRALLAARTLGRRRMTESVPALREAVQTGKDIYLRAAALDSLIAIEGARALQPWLDELSHAGPVTIRDVARRGLAAIAGEGPP